MIPRRIIPRLPLLRALVPRAVSSPLLPLTSRLRTQPLRASVLPSSSRSFHSSPSRLSSPEPAAHDPSTGIPPNASLSQRLKYLIKYYGWYALGVYLVLSVLDFSISFAAINIVGAEHVSRAAAAVKEYVASMIHSTPPEPGREEIESTSQHAAAGGQEGLYAMLVLAYTIHKTVFLPVRVGLTAGFTPKLVNWLGQRGWVGIRGTRRAAQHMRERSKDMRERINNNKP
ncbi:hypothetical protein GLOTRDRAFT_115365 [Gloeophyllum trabeum ATCC 11539]|uniref:DUF1279 domain-containing protein n=1 Tax=Gloeophyllum trabeum (strain ATCC 11539 / FP-39264 / Madison 617) TaxID=670483 RepID=S7RS15_GLOTA|nr:uncharacterized protein GLOTRDRAFT_115365 [Gloeophyllum trabeum ATCC 11539]EPQ57425.1 hypothetical protein GLOTRDRAFT_115365 [Gloeophyllum trabeum ATCC 11539]